jgi:hypothetical protein
MGTIEIEQGQTKEQAPTAGPFAPTVTPSAAKPTSSAGGERASDQIATFMARVVAWPGPGEPGFINLHYTLPNRDGLPGRPHTDLKSFLGDARWGATKPDIMKDIYFCMTRQSAATSGKNGNPRAVRLAQNATHAKALWIDADVKSDQPEKCYTSTSDLIAALSKFFADAALPVPSALVTSGSGGMHIYWISDRPLTIAEWRPYAEGLKALVIKHDFKCDAGLTTDSARVLRVPGTYNRKRDPTKPVVLKGLGPDYDFATELAHVAGQQPVTAAATSNGLPFDLSKFAGKMPAIALAPESFNISIKDERPLDPTEVFKNCPHYRESLRTGGKGQGQGLWMLSVLGTTWMDKGRDIAHAISEGYPTYDKDETDKMFDRKVKERAERRLGWPSCKAIESAGCRLCATCVYKGKIKSPLNLAIRQELPPAQPSFADPYADFVGPLFPLDVLPPTLAEFVNAEHHAMGADPSALAMAALTAVAGAFHAETCVRVGDGWFEKPILWTALIGKPSTMKSPVIDKVTKPLRDIDKKRAQDWQQQYKAWKQRPKPQSPSNSKSSTQPAAPALPPSPPRPARCVINDATAEKTAELLSRAPSGLLMVHDELAGWMDGFERYNAGASSRAFYLQSWNGGHFHKDRVGKGAHDLDAEIFVENLALGILGGIQPDRLAEMRDLTSDGLLQRFLPVLMRAAARGDENYPVASAEAKYNKLITSINDGRPEKYFFDDEARAVLGGMLDYLHKLEQVDGFSSALIGAMGKLRGYFARLCLVLQVARNHDPDVRVPLPPGFTPEAGERLRRIFVNQKLDSLADGLDTRIAISCQTAEVAERVVREFLLPHIFGLYDVVANGGKERDKVRAIANFILASDRDRLRPSDFTEGVRTLRGATPKELGESVGRICAMGWLRPEDDRYPAPRAWVVETGLREYFAERRRQAQAARAEAHKILLAGGSRPRATVSDKSA